MTQLINYYEYIKSPQWYARTEQVRLRLDGLCEVCELRWATEVHHRSYANLGNERDEELLSVCHFCHGMIHGKIEIRRRYIWKRCLPFLLTLKEEATKCLVRHPDIENQERT